MSGKTASTSLKTFLALLLTPLFLVSGVAETGTIKSSLTNPFYIQPRTGTQHIPLDGDWDLSCRDSGIGSPADLSQQSKWIRTQVPGSVQVALFRAGELPNPYIQMNAKKYVWVLGKTWYYRRSFTVPAAVKDQYAFLCFDGIDYYAKIWLNGHELGRHKGLQGGPMLEVGSLLKPDGPNELVVEVRAANYGMGDKFMVGGLTPAPPGDRVVIPWGLAGGNDLMTGGNGSKKKILPERKMSIEDYFPMGIWRPVRLEIVPRTHLARPFLSTAQANSTTARLHLDVEVDAGATGFDAKLNDVPGYDPALDQMGRYRNAFTSKTVDSPPLLRFQLLDKLTSRPVLTQNIPLHIYEGRNWVRQEIDFASPKLWWPNGMGAPYLYRVSVSLLQLGKPIDTIAFDYGIRTLRRAPSAGPKTQDRWTDWQFVVNNRKFFVKGMDWWTNDIFLDLPRDRYRWALQSAKAAGIQFGAHGAEELSRPTAFTSYAISSASWFGKTSPLPTGPLTVTIRICRTGRRIFGRSRFCSTSSASGTIPRWLCTAAATNSGPIIQARRQTSECWNARSTTSTGRGAFCGPPRIGAIFTPILKWTHPGSGAFFRWCPISASSALIACPRLAPSMNSLIRRNSKGR